MAAAPTPAPPSPDHDSNPEVPQFVTIKFAEKGREYTVKPALASLAWENFLKQTALSTARSGGWLRIKGAIRALHRELNGYSQSSIDAMQSQPTDTILHNINLLERFALQQGLHRKEEFLVTNRLVKARIDQPGDDAGLVQITIGIVIVVAMATSQDFDCNNLSVLPKTKKPVAAPGDNTDPSPTISKPQNDATPERHLPQP